MTEEKKTLKQRVKDSFMAFLIWREHHIKEKNFVLLLAFLVGILTVEVGAVSDSFAYLRVPVPLTELPCPASV